MNVDRCFSLLINHTMELLLFFDESGRIFLCNRAAERELGYGEGLRGQFAGEVFPGLIERTRTGLNIREKADGRVLESVAYRANKTCFPVEMRVIWDEACSCYLCAVFNSQEKTSVQRELEWRTREAEEALKVRNEFVANITHELRTPVNGILGNVQNLLEEDLTAGQRSTLKVVEHCCSDMNKMINNILDFSKLEAGRFVLEERLFRFREMMNYVAATHQEAVNAKGLKLYITIARDIPEELLGDDLRITQILNNLISNAVKFTASGRITVEVISTAKTETEIELFFIVMDTGIGIDEADKDKLFQSFTQADASITRRYGGTGLGLNISKQLVELMHGSINVESRKNMGSLFSFSIRLSLPGEKKDCGPQQPEALKVLEVGEEAESGGSFGSPENLEEIRSVLEKLILCIDMENWRRAEEFADKVKRLTAGASGEVSRAAFRLKMAVQKEDHGKASGAYDKLLDLLDLKGE